MGEFDDIDYLPKKDSAIELVDYWKRNQKQLDKFGKYGKMTFHCHYKKHYLCVTRDLGYKSLESRQFMKLL